MTKPGDSQTKKTLHELAKEFPEKTYRELEKYRDADRQEEALGVGGIGHTQSPDLVELMAIENEKVKKEADRLMMNKLSEIEDLKNRIADLEESLKSKDYFERPDYKFLVEENLNLRRKITELEQEVLETKADNIKMARQVDDQISQLRRAGLL